jgi:hypothetical protein
MRFTISFNITLLYDLALKSDIKTYSESHLQVAVIRNNLASALQATNQPQDLAKAIELYDLALKSDIVCAKLFLIIATFGCDSP